MRNSVLIVEDEKIVREGLARALSPNYKTYKAANGREAMEILKKNVPTTFVDMHEDVNSSNDYIWSDFDNDDLKIRNYCKANNLGMIYQPDIDEYYYSTVGTSQSFAREIGVKNCYTTETAQYAPFDKRLKRNKDYIKLFIGGI